MNSDDQLKDLEEIMATWRRRRRAERLRHILRELAIGTAIGLLLSTPVWLLKTLEYLATRQQ